MADSHRNPAPTPDSTPTTIYLKDQWLTDESLIPTLVWMDRAQLAAIETFSKHGKLDPHFAIARAIDDFVAGYVANGDKLVSARRERERVRYEVDCYLEWLEKTL